MDSVISLALLGAVIGANNLAVSLALGSLGQARNALRVVLVFGAFEFIMPLVGTVVGRQLSSVITDHTRWLSPTLLIVVGAWTVYGAVVRDIDVEELARRATTWGGLAVLSAMLSLDNLVVGLSLGLRDLSPLALASLISGFSMVFAGAGLWLGEYAHQGAPRLAGAASGALLVGLGVLLAAGVV